ncbi:MAG: sensor histidine kinase, partial [Candidatus Hydrothermarchaeales archaeon]
ELVANSLQHAFPNGRGGEIVVSLKSGGDKCFLKVSDTGKGMPGDVDVKNPESLGLKLVDTFVSQIDGTLELDRNNGTAFTVSFGGTWIEG